MFERGVLGEAGGEAGGDGENACIAEGVDAEAEGVEIVD